MQTITVGQKNSVQVLIDDEDAAFRNLGTWCVLRNGISIELKFGKKKHEVKRIMLHRLITGASRSEMIKHINGNVYDNRRANLEAHNQKTGVCRRSFTSPATALTDISVFVPPVSAKAERAMALLNPGPVAPARPAPAVQSNYITEFSRVALPDASHMARKADCLKIDNRWFNGDQIAYIDGLDPDIAEICFAFYEPDKSGQGMRPVSYVFEGEDARRLRLWADQWSDASGGKLIDEVCALQDRVKALEAALVGTEAARATIEAQRNKLQTEMDALHADTAAFMKRFTDRAA